MNIKELVDAHQRAMDARITAIEDTVKLQHEAIMVARRRIRQLCGMVNGIAGFSKVRVEDFLEGLPHEPH
jgi:hypothetical protein